jgi:hypothetical protein
MDKRFSVEQMKTALLATGSITQQQMKMLRAHYMHRTCSFEAMGTFAGYRNVRAARLQYGWMCRRIAWQLGFRTHKRKVHAIASEVPERDSGGNRQWRMDDVVIEALEQIGWVQVRGSRSIEDSGTQLTATQRSGRRSHT